jgi:hypothetical protein
MLAISEKILSAASPSFVREKTPADLRMARNSVGDLYRTSFGFFDLSAQRLTQYRPRRNPLHLPPAPMRAA